MALVKSPKDKPTVQGRNKLPSRGYKVARHIHLAPRPISGLPSLNFHPSSRIIKPLCLSADSERRDDDRGKAGRIYFLLDGSSLIQPIIIATVRAP